MLVRSQFPEYFPVEEADTMAKRKAADEAAVNPAPATAAAAETAAPPDPAEALSVPEEPKPPRRRRLTGAELAAQIREDRRQAKRKESR